jgi:hypothetical protein
MMGLAAEAGLWVTSVERLKAVEKFTELVAAYEREAMVLETEWVGLTDEEMKEIWDESGWYVTLFKKVEAKLKEKNSG